MAEEETIKDSPGEQEHLQEGFAPALSNPPDAVMEHRGPTPVTPRDAMEVPEARSCDGSSPITPGTPTPQAAIVEPAPVSCDGSSLITPSASSPQDTIEELAPVGCDGSTSITPGATVDDIRKTENNLSTDLQKELEGGHCQLEESVPQEARQEEDSAEDG